MASDPLALVASEVWPVKLPSDVPARAPDITVLNAVPIPPAEGWLDCSSFVEMACAVGRATVGG